MSPRRLLVEADGGSRGNPGPAGYGALVRDAGSGEVLDEVAAAIGTATNNVAEYCGLLAGLQAAAALDPAAQVEVRMDSKLVVEQMSGRWKIKHEDMRRLAVEARAVLPRDQVTYTWIPRALNSHADRLANEAMDAAARGERWVRKKAGADDSSSVSDDTAAEDAGPYADTAREGWLSPRQAWDLLAGDRTTVLVDVRTDAERDLVGVPAVPGSGRRLVSVPWSRWPDGARNPRFAETVREHVDPDAPLVLLSRDGADAEQAAKVLETSRPGRLVVVRDGFEGPVDEEGHRGRRGWRAEGLPWHQG